LSSSTIKVYTDGSCHTQLLLGAWAAIVFIGKEKVILSGSEEPTTHNRMELLAVINAIHYMDKRGLQNSVIEVYSDSQYVVNLVQRKEKLKLKNYITNKGTEIQNVDLVKQLIYQIENYQIAFTKVKAHQKDGDEINREVDMIVRKLVRKNVLSHG
jgi:ribonuclease HI